MNMLDIITLLFNNKQVTEYYFEMSKEENYTLVRIVSDTKEKAVEELKSVYGLDTSFKLLEVKKIY